MEGLIEKSEQFVRISFGSGYGSGNGYGYGSWYGYSSGYGSGYGSGSGNVNGYGSGNVNGSGYGSGYDYDIKSIHMKTVYLIDEIQTIISQIHGNIAKGFILNSDFTEEPCYVVKQGNLFAHGKTLKEAQKALLEKMFEDMSEDDRINAFVGQFKNTNIIVKNSDLFDWHNKLTGSCEQGRNAFVKNHEIDINDSMTIKAFINLTKSDYGGSIIKKLEESYKN